MTTDEPAPEPEPDPALRERRLHPAAIAVLALAALREAAAPIVILIGVSVAGGGLEAQALLRSLGFLALGVVLSSLVGLARWLTTTYGVTPDGIRLSTGMLAKKRTDVPLSRVQGLDTVQGPVQRLLGVVAVNVQTAGGGAKGEIALDALDPRTAEELREAVRSLRPELAAERPAAPATERRLSRPMLLVAALTAGQLGVILPLLAGGSQFVDDLLFGRGNVGSASRLLPDKTMEWLLAAAVLLAVAWALSVAGALVAFAGFRIARDGERLRIRRGLLQRSESTVPVHRVHGVRVVEGLLRRPFGLATLRVEVVGYAEEASAARTLFPLLRRREVESFLQELLPELADDPGGLEPPPRRAARRYLLPPALAGAAVAALVCALEPSLFPWPFALAVLLGLYGLGAYRGAGWRLRDGRLALRTRRLSQSTLLAPAHRLQAHGVAQNPLQRRGRLADVAVSVGAGAGARVRHLEASVAWELWERLRPRGSLRDPQPVQKRVVGPP